MQVSELIQKQIDKKVQRLESVFQTPTTESEPNESTIESSTNNGGVLTSTEKVSDFLKLCQDKLQDVTPVTMLPQPAFNDSTFNTMTACSDFSEPIPSKNILFEMNYQSPMNKMASLLESPVRNEQDENQ
jgi:hypothetical protein